MSLKKLYKIFLALVILNARAAFAENDLSPWKLINLDITVYTAVTENANSVAMFTLPHNYSNSLKCSFSVDIPVLKNNAIVLSKKVNVKNILIFPEAAFDNSIEYPIDVTLNEGERIKAGFNKTFLRQASCFGWDTRKALPKETCDVLVPDSTQVCSLLYPGQKTFPVIKSNQYLGACECMDQP